MIKTDTLWKGSFFAVALAGLYFAWKKPESVQAIQQGVGDSIPSPSTVTFGGYQGASNQAGDISIGGSPVYLTYNYPPATNPVVGSGTTAAQGPSATPAPPISRPPKVSDDCGGCKGDCGKCPQTQYTQSGLAMAYAYSTNDVSNLLSLLSK